MPPGPFGLDLQALQAIQTMHSFVVNVNALALEQDMDSLVAITHPAAGQSPDLLAQRSVSCRPDGFAVIRRAGQSAQATGTPNGYGIVAGEIARHMPAL